MFPLESDVASPIAVTFAVKISSGYAVNAITPDAVLPENKKSGIYIVRQGDTLWAIARKCGCSVAEIVSLNRELIRNPALIYSGWELKVPQN